jgi:hypothetical protein
MKIMTAVAAAAMMMGSLQMATAQEAEHGGLRGACRADFQAYCSGIPAGGGSRIQCLNDHRVNLSDACKTALTSMKTARQACELDAAKYCPEAAPGADRLKCMSANKDKLSEGCKAALSATAVGAD